MFWRKHKNIHLISAVFLGCLFLSGCDDSNNRLEEIEQAREMGYEMGMEEGYSVGIDDVKSGLVSIEDTEICLDYYELGYQDAITDIEKYGITRVKNEDLPREVQ